jgi:hypothetical protein
VEINPFDLRRTGLSTKLDFDLSDPILSVSPVPELSTWAMMILGFMGIGYSRRRQPAALHVA